MGCEKEDQRREEIQERGVLEVGRRGFQEGDQMLLLSDQGQRDAGVSARSSNVEGWTWHEGPKLIGVRRGVYER